MLAVIRSGAVGFIDWLGNLNIFNFDLHSTKPLGQSIVDSRKNYEEYEAQDSHENRHQRIDGSQHLNLRSAEEDHWDADKSVNKPKQDIHSSHYLTGLQDGDSDDLFFHDLEWLRSGWHWRETLRSNEKEISHGRVSWQT